MNLFLTVGTQLPFDRLTRALDGWCGQMSGTGIRVFGQIGPAGASSYRPKHFEWTEFLTPDGFGARFEAASHIVSHAGMGTIITAMVARKPITILPRRKALGEQHNDHQMATIRNLAGKPGVFTAETEVEVPRAIGEMLSVRDALNDAQAKLFGDTTSMDTIRAEILV